MTKQTERMYQVKYITARDVSGGYNSDPFERAKNTQDYINDVCSVLAENDCQVLSIDNAHSFPIIIKYIQSIK